MPTDFSSSQNLFGPLNSSRKIRAVHLLPTICMADAIQPDLGSIDNLIELDFIALQSIVLGLQSILSLYKVYHKGEDMNLAVITGSTRPNRKSPRQSKWIVKTANTLEGVTSEHLDLKDYQMPFFDEPMSPRFNSDRKLDDNVKNWLEKLNSFDAYVFVTPEYNHSMPAVLKNSLDFVTTELSRKPSAVASHGTDGGVRAAMHLNEVLLEVDSIVIPNFSAIAGLQLSKIIDEDGVIDPEVASAKRGPQSQLNRLLAELKWYSDALAAARSTK